MKKLTFLLFACLPLLLMSCTTEVGANSFSAVEGAGSSVRRTLDLDPFTGIKLAISANVTITQGQQQSVEIEAQDNIIDLINTEVNDGVWKIKTRNSIRKARNIHIYITVPRLTEAHISGSGSIMGTNTFTNSEDLSIGVSGSGSIKLAVETGALEAGISGSGDINLRGNANSLEIRISGSGDVDALDFMTQDADIRTSGSGDCRVHATRELNIKTSGSGDVQYKGQARVTSRSSGSGGIEAI